MAYKPRLIADPVVNQNLRDIAGELQRVNDLIGLDAEATFFAADMVAPLTSRAMVFQGNAAAALTLPPSSQVTAGKRLAVLWVLNPSLVALTVRGQSPDTFTTMTVAANRAAVLITVNGSGAWFGKTLDFT